MSKCGDDLKVGLLDTYDTTLNRKHIITAGTDMEVQRVDHGSFDEDIISYAPYSPPDTTITLTPSILEKGLTPAKSSIKVRFQVAKGKNTVSSIESANFGINITDPSMPYDSGELDHYGAGDIGTTEVISASMTVNDGTDYTTTKNLVRGYRAFYGVSSTPTLTGDGAMAAADTEEVITGVPSDQTFDCGSGGYWFVMVESNINLEFTINGFVLSPIEKLVTIQPIDGNSYQVDYNLYISPAENTGIVNVVING